MAWHHFGSGIRGHCSEIADYEVRRELIRAGLTKSLRRLDALHGSLEYLPISTDAMRKAAELWADIRRQGKPTAHEKNMDADAILAGQAATLSRKNVVIATTNRRHIFRYFPAEIWHDIWP